MQENVILVDENDQVIGQEEKIAAHEKALRHRAFSVFVYRDTTNGTEILLQQRNPNKYHCGNLWTNTTCGHPRPGEDTLTAGERRLFEEMGIQTTLQEVGVFEYQAVFDNGLTEHEVDHVLVGKLQQDTFTTNPEEVCDHQWWYPKDLLNALADHPHHFTPWLKQALLTSGL